MQVETRLGTCEEVREGAGALAPILDAVRGQIEDLHPDATEAASRKEMSVWWGHGPRKMKEVYAMAHPTHVNPGFYQGVSLPDPQGLLDGTGKALRHVRPLGPEDAMAPGVRDHIIAARDERLAALKDS